jgi:hypothetical protein
LAPISAQNISILFATIVYDQESSTASDLKFPCKPLLGPSPELMQPQTSLRVVQGSIVWRQHIRGACWRWKCEVLGRRGLSEAIFALAVPAWHRIVHRTANFRNYGKLRSSKIVLRSYGKVTAVTVLRQRTVQSAPYRTPYSAQAWAFAWFWCRHAENGYS